MENDIIAIVMAAGKGTRMKSKNSKLVQKIYGKEIVKRAVENAEKAGVKDIVAVVGYKKEEVMKVLGDNIKYAFQDEMLGTGHAVMQAKEYLKGKKGKVLVLNGDVPLIRPETLNKLIEKSIENKEYATLLTAIYDDPTGYGRIVRDEGGNIEGIVEEKDTTEEQKKITEINAGIYCFDIEALLEALEKITPNNKQGEYYITDVIQIMNNRGLKTGAVIVEDNTEILGINDRIQLGILTKVLQMRINTELMKHGVTIEDTNTTYIYDDVEIGMDTVIHPNTTIKSGVIIGEDCEIGPNSYIREGCKLANKVKIGSFVEIKKAIIGEGTKVPHLSYMGDCEIGEKCNIGCGTITCNYDGFNKSKTIIGNHSFIGSNTNLVAPVTLGDNTFIAAGSTITDDVPEYALAIARERQTNKENWNKK
ncbi:bifunctional protein GlmU [Clostridium sp. CAG:273]|jgi:bifunctional UDP-N-acetylglucosamine pyrophosphorylase/glucosamine-1-phosphate N-acetyltransferase|nr:sugar phosphate nucleotidyltransferase [Clostridia bacterium]CDE83443.1 bifunctional protein GlmU [Clostridium sp. CAG:273]